MHRALLLLLAAALLCASSHFGYLSFAGSTRPDLVWLDDTLGLTPAQAEASRRLHAEWSPRFAALRTRLARERHDPAARPAAESACKASTSALIAQMAALLTPDQKQKYYDLVAVCIPPADAAAAAQRLNPAPPR